MLENFLHVIRLNPDVDSYRVNRVLRLRVAKSRYHDVLLAVQLVLLCIPSQKKKDG